MAGYMESKSFENVADPRDAATLKAIMQSNKEYIEQTQANEEVSWLAVKQMLKKAYESGTLIPEEYF